ncbi:hypothetical protein [Nocardioides speluncae]|uniref:hypothetical protein n=1 Tax=Nocardioides speluncae TaxID=2670337 RepID=UPI000D685727|nr:hypothetical protein [Nocardioides speluncae]
MSQNNDDLGDLIGRELHNRVDDWSDAPLTFQDVRGRAKRIRRGRRIAAGVGVAAAAAILVPTALIAGSGLDRSEPDPAPTGPTQSATGGTPSANTSADPTGPTQNQTATEGVPGEKAEVPLDVSNLDAGDLPAVTWLEGTAAHLASGETLELPEAYASIAEVGDRLVVTSSDDQGNLQVTVLSAAGDIVSSYPVDDGRVVANRNRTAAAWIGPDGVPMVLQDGRPEPVQLAQVEGTDFGISGLVGDDCSSASESEGPSAAGCQVYVDTQVGEERTSWVVSSDGSVDRASERVLGINAVNADGSRLVALTSLTDTEGCWEAMDSSYRPEWESCRDNAKSFSPDGQYVLAILGLDDGFGPLDLSVLRADSGESVVHFQRADPSGTPFDMVWEDPEHLLAAVFQGNEWSIVRFGLDGSMEYAVPPRTGPDLPRLFVLATQ